MEYLAGTSEESHNGETEAPEKKPAGEYKGQDSSLVCFFSTLKAYAVCTWKGGPALCALLMPHSSEALIRPQSALCEPDELRRGRSRGASYHLMLLHTGQAP